MTQHSLELDPSRKDEEFDSLGDTWSRAEALLEELPRQRQRQGARRSNPSDSDGPSLQVDHATERDACDSGEAESDEESDNGSQGPMNGLRHRTAR